MNQYGSVTNVVQGRKTRWNLQIEKCAKMDEIKFWSISFKTFSINIALKIIKITIPLFFPLLFNDNIEMCN